MGDMDKIKAMGLPANEGAFSESKDPLLGKGALIAILNAVQSQLSKGNQVRRIEAANLAAAGGAVTIAITGEDWSTTVADWEVKANGAACTVASPTKGTGEVTASITTPAITSGHTAVVAVKVKKIGGTELEYAGSISMPVS